MDQNFREQLKSDKIYGVDEDKNIRLLAFAFTIVFVWTAPKYF